MCIYLHKNKLKYNDGQLAPFLIVILVILIIAAIVTINLGKVALIRTDTTNAADAGALAAGSGMARVFNAVASANAVMEKAYWTFYTAISVSYVLAFWQLTVAYLAATAALAEATVAEAAAGSALAQACPSPCTAMGTISVAAGSLGAAIVSIAAAIAANTWFIKTTTAILIATMAYWIAQWYYYNIIRRMAREGRQSAIGAGLSYAFTNSGIGSKLKEGEPPEGMTDQQRRNYRDEFSDFLDDEIGGVDVGEGEEYDPPYLYDWEDGQERIHSVEVDVSIGEVDTYDLKVAALPILVEIALLSLSLDLAYSAEVSLGVAGASYGAAGGLYLTAVGLLATACWCQACCLFWPPCCACWWSNCTAAMGVISGGMVLNATGIAANTAAIASMFPIPALMATAWAGLLPDRVIRSDSDWDPLDLLWILCWIEDIRDSDNPDQSHDRLVRVDTTQQHEGADLVLWQTRYPETHSYSVVDFSGEGCIHPPSFGGESGLPHDASIIETD